ncbi:MULTISPECIES: RecQ family ATP-dependent DNA helicase [Enterococcus]|uniref:ATP-dependent DNA helicase RecQ n=1 Tax=Enterococcus alishanensis TaxID=1303817 RepID=A0ABS6TAT3_9ENTE|nr:ATP-dependent DNA helicase RecQ [Enterococcus alishanensis]MBV7390000.1 ATP-dependent DNA helicase [Enterococcus alishanensis]
MELKKALEQYFGYSEFRPGQAEIISTVLKGEPVLGMLPTGTGKSLCYQLAGYLLPGTVIIISPLISLMEDQVNQLQQLGEKRVIALNSVLSYSEKDYVLKNMKKYKFIFMSPEMFLQEKIMAQLKTSNISLVVVDEAHCISQWGIDFRPEYLKLSAGIHQLPQPRIMALTATATPNVREDIKHLLFHHQVKSFVYSVDRPNISYFVFQAEKKTKLRELLETLSGTGIVYCATRKQVESLYQLFRNDFPVAFYHGGLSGQERRVLQQQFQQDELKVLFATNAFGMGINKNNIRYVIHYDLPDSPENYLQEIGRAGRDGHHAQAILLYENNDEKIHYFLQDQINDVRKLYEMKQQNPELLIELPLIKKWETYFPDQSDQIISLLEKRQQVKRQQIRFMLAYVQQTECRRKFLTNYFAEKLEKIPKTCCDNHGATLTTVENNLQEKVQPQSWQEILEKIFKNPLKI